jgi:hypothetical protein
MTLHQNVGPVDRSARLLAGAGLVTLALAGITAAPVTYVVIAAAAILVVTGLTGFCPLYALLGIRTVPAPR